jgi:hypothetical protein
MLIKVDPSKVDAIEKAKRIGELKSLLAASDYKAMPDYDKPDPAILAKRQAWREEIRALEAQHSEVAA